MEPSPPSPSKFLNLPPVPNGDGDGPLFSDDMVLSYISRMLMEDDIDDKLLCQYSDHPALSQVEQSFAQILPSPFFGATSDNTINKDNTEETKDLWQGPSGDQSTLSSAFPKGAHAVGAILKGTQQASEFLPRDSGFTMDCHLNRMFTGYSNCGALRKSYNRCDHPQEVGRSSKTTMVMQVAEPQEIGTHEMFDEMMLRGYETCIRDMEKLRIDMANEAEKNNRKGGTKVARYVVDLCDLLIRCAQAVDANNHTSACELLKQIKQHASAKGDATQRLAQCFLKGLEARLGGMGRQLLIAEHPSVMDFLKAYKLYMAACCFHKVALVFSIVTIHHVMMGKNKLHIVDYGLHHGFQWAGLLRLLADREGGPPEVKITVIGRPQLWLFPIEWIEETGRSLSKCACEFGLPSFKFHVITTKWEEVCIENLNTNADEALVVNELFNFSTLMDEGIYFDDRSPRDTVLNNIRKMRPDVFIQGVVNRSYGTSFLTRFREMMFYYSAMFDVLDATMPRESEQRLMLERDILAPCALNVIACEGRDRMDRANTYKQWQLRNQRAGLRQLPLAQEIVNTVRDAVKKHQYHKDFVISEDHRWLLQGWKGRILYAHSTWVADDSSL